MSVDKTNSVVLIGVGLAITWSYEFCYIVSSNNDDITTQFRKLNNYKQLIIASSFGNIY